MIKKNVKKNPPSVYFVGEKVFVKAKQPSGIKRGGRSFGKPLVHLATIVDASRETYRYKVTYTVDGKKVTAAVSVGEITSLTRAQEQKRQDDGNGAVTL
jgi:hypothetical protein